MNKSVLLKKAKRLHRLFTQGKIATLPHLHEVNPGLAKGSRRNYLYFTLPPCLNYQRSSPAMWRSALATYKDPSTRYLFLPEEVVKRTRGQVQRDLLKHKLALQKNKHTDIWRGICNTLHTQYKNDPRELIRSNNSDVSKIIQTLRIDKKPDFPHLSGPKMSNYWLYILHQYTDVDLKNLQEISIIPDTHVINCSMELGLIDKPESAERVAELWKDLLSDSNLAPIDMHPVLWNWSRAGFKPGV